MILDQCPYCKTRHVQTQRQAATNFKSGTKVLEWRLERCQNPQCRQLVLVEASQSGNERRVYPAGVYEFASEAETPDQVKEEFREAGKCLDAGCAKASMVMSRRVLQRCLRDQGCDQHRLLDAIDCGVERGIIRPALEAVATEVREYGNLSAHPDDEQLENANLKSAKQILEFVRLLIHDFYELPATASKLRSDREGVEGNSG